MDDAKLDEARQKLSDSGVRPGDIYRHYKGGSRYVVVALAIQEATLEPMVIYRRESDFYGVIAWSRPLSEWNEYPTVEGVKWGEHRYRLVFE
jgi:hypothetical protein